MSANESGRRLEGREEIQLQNIPLPLQRLVVEWPYAPSEELKIRFQNEPVKVLSKGTNGLSSSQLLFELPQIIEKGKSASLEIEFSCPLRLQKVTKLTDWHPRVDWGRNSVADYEVKLRAPSGYLVATSGAFDPAKDSYSAAGCRGFGLIFMKDLKVLTAKSRDTEIYSYYDDATRKCVEFTHETAVEVIDFYRQWLGFYPAKILHIIPGGLGHPAGGYPVATAIVGIHGQAQMAKAPESHWRFITAHEIGHQYWLENVLEAPGEFWLMIGLGVYADRSFMLAKGYGDQHERDMMSRYIRGVREDLDTRMDRLPEEVEEVGFDYNNVVNHGKGFAVISALACTLGKEPFEAAYKRCLNEFNGRTLAVSDFQRICEQESGQTLDWFFDQWVRTSRFLSCGIASRETVSDAGKYVTTARVRNLGTLSMPVPVTATFEDGSSQCLFTERLQDESSLTFTSKVPVKELLLDARHELALVLPPPDANLEQLQREIRRLNVVGESDKALQIYTKAKPATLEKLSASQLFVLGMSLFDGGHDKESLQAFRNCAVSEKNTDRDYKLLGWVWQGHLLDILDRRDEAVASYKGALQYCDADTDIRHDQYGMRITKAWVEKRIQSAFQRPDPKLLELRSRIDRLQYTGDGERALELFKETKNVSKTESGLSWGKLGLCLYDGKHYPEALQAFKSDFAENPTSFSSLVWQGHLLDLMNQRPEALACYKQALAMNPTSWVRHDQYGIKLDVDWIQQRIKAPFQRVDARAATSPPQDQPSAEPQLADLLKEMGCEDAAIKHPLSVGLFKSAAKPSVKIVQKNGRAEVLLGWYQQEQEHPLFENISGPTPLKNFEPGESPFGFYIRVDFQGKYKWHTETARNSGEPHVKVFPMMSGGKTVPDSHLLCWEDIPLGVEEGDYQDIIVQVSGLQPVASQEFGRDTGEYPKLRFHVWGSVPFPNAFTATPRNQHILFCIRKDARRTDQIAKEVKISNEEASEALSTLAKYDLVKATNDSRWFANFPIFAQAEILQANEIGIKYGRLQADLLREHIPNLKTAYEQCQVAQYHPWSKTSLVIVGALCADFCVSDRIRFKPQYFNEKFLPPRHPDGRRWGYSGEEVLSSPLPFRKYQFYQNVLEDQEGGITRFGYYSLIDEQRKSPPARPENLRHQPEGKIWLALPAPATFDDIKTKTDLSPTALQPALDKMTGWNPPGLVKETDGYRSAVPILSSGDLGRLLPAADQVAEIIFNKITVPMEDEMEREGKKLGLRFPLPSGTSARDIALQILSEEGVITPIPQPPVPWNSGVWGWNGHIQMWEDFR